MVRPRPWRYQTRNERRRQQSAEFWQYARRRFQEQQAQEQRQRAARRPAPRVQQPPEDDGGGGFLGGIGDALAGGANAVTRGLTGQSLSDIKGGYEDLEGGLQSIFGVATGAPSAMRRIDDSGQAYREAPSWGDAFSTWGDAIRDPIGTFGGAEEAFEERLRDPAHGPIERGILGGITAPETYATAGFGGAAAGAVRGAGGAAAPLWRRTAANFAEPVVRGNVGRRFAGELGLETGARAGAEELGDRFGPVGTVVGALGGGLAGAQAYRGFESLARPGGLARAQGRAGRQPLMGMGIEDVSDADIDDFMRQSYPGFSEAERARTAEGVRSWRNRFTPEEEGPDLPRWRTEINVNDRTSVREGTGAQDPEDMRQQWRELSERVLTGGEAPPREPPTSARVGGAPEPSEKTFEVPEIGFGGAREALGARLEVMTKAGDLGGNPDSKWRRARAFVTPAYGLTDTARVADTARGAIEAKLTTDFDHVMKPLARRLAQLAKERPPRFIGPDDHPAKIRGSVPDIAENPDFYALDDQWRQAIDGFNQGMWNQVSGVARSEYGVAVRPFKGKPGSAYVPHIPKKGLSESKVDVAMQSLQPSARTKQRAYQTLAERIKANEDFEPELDIMELTEIHGRSMARSAAQETYKLGIGAKTKTEVIEEINPSLVTERQALSKLVDKLRGRINTTERRIRLEGERMKLRERDLKALAEKRDRFMARISARDDPRAVRQAKREAAQEAAMELRLMREEAMQAARALGRTGQSTRGPMKRLQKLAGRAETLARKVETARETRETLEATRELDPGRPQAGELSRDEIREYWDQLRQLKGDIRDAHTEEMTAFRGWGETQEEIGQTAETIMARQGAAADQSAAKEALRKAEHEALAAAREAGEAKDDTVLVALNKQLGDLDTRVRQLGREAAKAGLKKGEQQQLQGGLKEALNKVLADKKKLQRAYDTINLREHGYDYESSIHRYLPKREAQSVRELMQRNHGGFNTLLDTLGEARQIHLSVDMSPIGIQYVLGILGNPALGARVTSRILREGPREALERIAREQPEEASKYSFWTGRTIGTQTTEFGMPKGVRRFKKGKAWEDWLFANVQHQQFEHWKNERNFLMKMGMPEDTASREAAFGTSNIIPQMLQMERGRSPARAQAEQSFITSTSFAMTPVMLTKDMGRAAAKLAFSTEVNPKKRLAALTGREIIALRRGGTLAGTMMGLAGATAAMSAESRDMDVREAVLEAMDPRSKYFMSIQLGNGNYIPIGSPLRGFYRALAPFDFISPDEKLVNWAKNKVTSATMLPFRLSMNEDWRGEPIRDGDAVTQLVQSAMYLGEQTLPIFAGTPLEGARLGEDVGETAWATAGQWFGTSPMFATPNDKLNEEARRRFDTDSFWDLEPHQQEKIREQNPDLWNRSVAEGSDERQQATAFKEALQEEQKLDDQALLDGQISMREWRDARRQRGTQLRTANEIIYSESDTPERDRPIDRYYAAIDHFQVNGRVDWNAVDEWVAAQPQEDQAYIERNTSLGGTELEQKYKELGPQRDEYFSLPKYRGYDGRQAQQIDDLYERARASLGLAFGQQAEDYQMLRAIAQFSDAYDPQIVQGARRRAMGLLNQTSQRDQYLRSHPELRAFMSSSYLSPDQMELLSSS